MAGKGVRFPLSQTLSRPVKLPDTGLGVCRCYIGGEGLATFPTIHSLYKATQHRRPTFLYKKNILTGQYTPDHFWSHLIVVGELPVLHHYTPVACAVPLDARNSQPLYIILWSPAARTNTVCVLRHPPSVPLQLASFQTDRLQNQVACNHGVGSFPGPRDYCRHHEYCHDSSDIALWLTIMPGQWTIARHKTWAGITIASAVIAYSSRATLAASVILRTSSYQAGTGSWKQSMLNTRPLNCGGIRP